MCTHCKFQPPPPPVSFLITCHTFLLFFQCNNPSTDDTFIAEHPLVNELVVNYNSHNSLTRTDTNGQVVDISDPPLFFSNGVRYSAIVVDKRTPGSIDDDVLFVGTGMCYRVNYFFVKFFIFA